ncbi:MAG: FHA domain-containing protein [Gemmatimonadales bacterium]
MQLELSGRHYTVAADALVIGSDPASTVHLPSPGVLPRHAVVRQLREGLAVVEPGAPGAEILLNGTPLGADPTPVMHGDKIRIGNQDITVADPRKGGATAVLQVEIEEDPDATAESPIPSSATSGRPGMGTPPPGPGISSSDQLPIALTVDPSAEGVPRLVSLSDGREYRIEVVPFVIGRDAGCEVVVESTEVSRRHAEIVTRPDGDVIVDTSSNGTFVNGTRIEGRKVLEAGDLIRVGDEEFRYYPVEKPLPPPGADFRLADTMIGFRAIPRRAPQPFLAPSEPPLATMLVREGALIGQRLHIRTPVVNIGRAEFNDIKLPDPSVSASHAKLQLREGVWIISDLGSTNGVTVDGERVKGEAPLSPGAQVLLGQVRLLFEPKDELLKGSPGTVVLDAKVLDAAKAAPREAPVSPRDAAHVLGKQWKNPKLDKPKTKWSFGRVFFILLMLALVVALILGS